MSPNCPPPPPNMSKAEVKIYLESIKNNKVGVAAKKKDSSLLALTVAFIIGILT